MNVIFTLIEAAGLVLVIWIGFALFGNTQIDYFSAPHGLNGIFSAFTLVFLHMLDLKTL